MVQRAIKAIFGEFPVLNHHLRVTNRQHPEKTALPLKLEVFLKGHPGTADAFLAICLVGKDNVDWRSFTGSETQPGIFEIMGILRGTKK